MQIIVCYTFTLTIPSTQYSQVHFDDIFVYLTGTFTYFIAFKAQQHYPKDDNLTHKCGPLSHVAKAKAKALQHDVYSKFINSFLEMCNDCFSVSSFGSRLFPLFSWLVHVSSILCYLLQALSPLISFCIVRDILESFAQTCPSVAQELLVLEDEGPWSPGSLIIRISMRGMIPVGQIEL